MLLLSTLIPTLLILGFSYYAFQYITTDEIRKSNKETLTSVANTFDMIYSESEKILLYITMDNNIAKMTQSKHTNYTEKMTLISTINKIINTFIFQEEFIHSINIYFDNNDFFFSTTGDNGDIDKITDKSWYNDYLNKKDKVDYWISTRELGDSTKKQVITINKLFSSADGHANVVMINIDVEKLNLLLENTINSSKYAFLTLDENANIIHYTNAHYLDLDIEAINESVKNLSEYESDYSGPFNNIGQKMVLSFIKSRYNRWIYTSVISMENYYNRLSQLLAIALYCTIFMLIIDIIIAFMISLKMYNPIGRIISLLEDPMEWTNASNDNFFITANELKYIEKNIINTYQERTYLKNELDTHLKALKKATAVALQSQMNPHFLYNTIESINWKALRILGANNEISNMLCTLSKILRYNLDSNQNYIKLSDEMEHANVYLSLQSNRYKNLFDVIWDVQKDLEDYYVIKFLLQPIIENAIYHGIKPAGQKCFIKITIYIKDNDMLIIVHDDGVGIRPEQLNTINSSFDSENNTIFEHIGLKNTNQRIKLLCGDKYGIKLQSKAGEGTDVIITLPNDINHV